MLGTLMGQVNVKRGFDERSRAAGSFADLDSAFRDMVN